MTLSIDINDQELKEVVEKGIKELNSETVGEIAKEAIKNYMQNPEVMKNLLFECEKRYSYDYTYYSNPQKWFLDLFANCFTHEEIEDYRQKMLSIVEQEKEGIIIKTLAEIFSKMLVTDEFRYKMQSMIASARN
jgi:hypothetical protein